MPTPIADLEGITVRRPGTVVLRGLSLRLEPGEAVGVFGANGSGKTTLLRVLATLLRPSAGTGAILGAVLGSDQIDAIRPGIALVGHEPALAPQLTLGENLRLVADLAGLDHRTADGALADVGLGGAAGRRVAHCSNGMKRRAEFARVLLTAPRLLLLDEAHVGLDPEAVRLVAHAAETVTAAGGAVVLVSHERERAAGIIDRAVELRDGALSAVRP